MQYILHTLNADTKNYFALKLRLKHWVWMTAKWRILTIQSSKIQWETRKGGRGKQQNYQVDEYRLLISAVMEKLFAIMQICA